MNITLDPQTQNYITLAVKEGRYPSVSALVNESIKQLEMRDAKIADIRKIIQTAIAEDEWHSSEEVEQMLADTFSELRQQGYK